MIIAVDTCVMVDFQSGISNIQVAVLKEKIFSHEAYLPPIVLTEFLSDPRLDKQRYVFLQKIPLLEITSGYWYRAGETRNLLLRKGLKAKLGDALIAQACIDNKVPLLTRDDDFRHYAKYCDLELVQNN